MKREELKNKIECKEEELLKLKEELKNIKDTNFEYNIDNTGWCIDEFGDTVLSEYFEDEITANYNYFTNEEYAEKIAFKQYFERKLLAYKEEYGDKCDWDNKYKFKYSVCITNNVLEIDNVCYSKDSCIFFNSKELLQKHIEENKEEWLRYFYICKELD